MVRTINIFKDVHDLLVATLGQFFHFLWVDAQETAKLTRAIPITAVITFLAGVFIGISLAISFVQMWQTYDPCSMEKKYHTTRFLFHQLSASPPADS
jgi:hypothetical protein